MAVGLFGISLLLVAARVAQAQTPGEVAEVHPKLRTYTCTLANGCKNQTSALVLDSNLHPIHQLTDTTLTCGDAGSPPNTTVCPDAATCEKNCIIEGLPVDSVDANSSYRTRGVIAFEDIFLLHQITDDVVFGPNAGEPHPQLRRRADIDSLHPRVYLLTPDETEYQQFTLDGNGLEIAFDVDVTRLPCGMNGAFYLVEMDPTGGLGDLNPAGAPYGTGYCDAQCSVYTFIDGVGNIDGKGACCTEIDLWEANARATQLSARPCAVPGLFECTDDECDDPGVCSKTGCKQNPYALGYKGFYGENMTVDTREPFTVITRFIEENGCLATIQRAFYQHGNLISNRCLTPEDRGRSPGLTDNYCCDQGFDRYLQLGGTRAIGEALGRGMTLAASIWWDEEDYMNGLDSDPYGPCGPDQGKPKNILAAEHDPVVFFGNIRWGELGSTLASLGDDKFGPITPSMLECAG